jgi:hypothetical protein
MPLEAESPSERQPGLEKSAPGVSSRPLGRGLEDVSHLFLSRAAPAPAGPPGDETEGDRATDRPPGRTGVAVLRPGPPLARDLVIHTLQECRTALVADLQAIAAGAPCGPYGDIDLLALGADRGLVIIDVETTPSDGLLLRGLSHADWVVGHMPLVQRLYPGWAIDTSRPPRVLLAAPAFSPAVRGAIRRIRHQEIACFRYHVVELSGRAGILVERVAAEGDS